MDDFGDDRDDYPDTYVSTVDDLADLVLTIAQSLVADPSAVRLERVDAPDCTLLQIKVTPQYYRFVCGTGGCGFKAMKTIVVLMSGRIGKMVRLSMAEGK